MSDQDIQPADCHARALRIVAEIDLIRQEMGRAADKRPMPTFKNAAPREVYFEALALFRKSDRLGLELAGDQLDELPHAPSPGQLRPKDCFEVLGASLRELEGVKARLGMADRSAEPKPDASKTPSDVLTTIVAANRALNGLLEHPFSPSDVYQQVAWASLYADRLLAKFPGATDPTPPSFARKKRPSDCYDQLMACADVVRRVIVKSGGTMVELTARGDLEAVPGDVYDLAALVLAEVAFLHGQAQDTNPPYPYEVHTPTRKLPSHVWQRAAYLHAQLEALAIAVDKQPDWLNRK